MMKLDEDIKVSWEKFQDRVEIEQRMSQFGKWHI